MLSKDCATLGFVSNALLGVFGSSLATMAVFCYEYQDEKRKLLKEYCENIASIQGLCSNLQFVNISDGNQIAQSLLSREKDNVTSPLQGILEKYLQIQSYLPVMRSLYGQIDFFSDHSFLMQLKKWNLLSPKENAKQLNAREIEAIQEPLLEFLEGISAYVQKHVLWYCQGFLSYETHAISGLQNLQRLCFDARGKVLSQRWYERFTSLTQS